MSKLSIALLTAFYLSSTVQSRYCTFAGSNFTTIIRLRRDTGAEDEAMKERGGRSLERIVSAAEMNLVHVNAVRKPV